MNRNQPRTRVILLTSTHERHRYVAGVVARHLELAGLWQEEKSFDPESYAGSDQDLADIREHFAGRDQSERAYFGASTLEGLSADCQPRRLPAGAINHPQEVAAMVQLRPEMVLVFGTGLLGRQLLESFPGRVLNIHLGLSPYYRGSGTNFWPLVNGEPEQVGATIHFVDPGIDTGRIIAHVRPPMAAGDGPHDLGNKTIQAAAAALVEAAQAVAGGGVRAWEQSGPGRLFQRKDFNARAVRRLYRNFAEGMIPRYLAEKDQRDARLHLVQLERK